MSNYLQLDKVNLSYGSRTVISNISLEAGSGQMVGIIGPNGSGKSTILKALCGLNRPIAGTVRLDGVDLSNLSREELARQIGVVPQSPPLPDNFTVLETVLMGRYAHLGLLRYESRRDLDITYHAMERTNIQSLAHRRVGQISGGEKQRVLVARALAQEPRFLILDEPTTHLDIQHQLEVMELVRSLVDSGLGVIAALHDFSLAGRFCDRLLLLKDGCIFKEGTPQTVITPENVEQCFGVMAMVYGDLSTGMLVVNASLAPARSNDGLGHIHVIGGGGSAGAIMQRLYSEGYHLTTGVLNQSDTDLSNALALGVEAIAIPAFSYIDDESHRRNLEMAAYADCCLLTDVPFGQANLLNLEAAAAASCLVLIDDTPIDQRDFTGGKATSLYTGLKVRALCTDTANSIATIKKALLQREEANAQG